MKKIMWIVAMIPVVVTSVVLQFMPDIIPMHHDLEGNTDRWGSKTESFILLGYRQMQVVNMRLLTLQKFHVFCVVLYLLY